jgi:hypothetical protein
MGLAKVRAKLNAEGIPGPRGAWAVTGVREVLHRRDYIGQIITNRHQRARDDDGNPIRIEQAKGWSSVDVCPTPARVEGAPGRVATDRQ